MNHSHLLARALCAFVYVGAILASAWAADISGPSEATGSILVYPYYTSSNGGIDADTRLTIANTDIYRREGTVAPALSTAYVHLFFIDGQTCNQSDQFVCLTPNATFTLKASDFDPDVTGYMIAVAVDQNTGNLVNQNSLIGDAFVSDRKYIGNYGAEAFQAYGNPGINNNGVINFGNTTNGYDFAPTRFVFSIQSPVDAPGQRIVTASINGNLSDSSLNGAGQVGVGAVYNGNERPFGSFVGFHQGSCQAISVIGLSVPRVPFGMSKLIPSGQVGTMMLSTGPAVGLFMTPTGNNKWSGIRGLHKNRVNTASLAIPMFIPVC